MTKKFNVRVKNKIQVTPDLEQRCASAAGLVKQIMGVANNAAWLVALDAYDKLKKLPNWRQQVKGGHTVAQNFKRVFDAFHDYEKRLIYDQKFRYFDLQDMPERTRKMYGNISNREYYDFWTAIGGSSYSRTRPLVTSLWNKYRVALIRSKIDDKTADIAAWGMCAEACLNSASNIYHMSLEMVNESFELPMKALELNFYYFDLKKIAELWDEAMQSAIPKIFETEISDTDGKNISDGIRQILEAWTDGDNIYDDMEKTLEECGEDVMKTKGYIRKAIDEVRELREYHDSLP